MDVVHLATFFTATSDHTLCFTSTLLPTTKSLTSFSFNRRRSYPFRLAANCSSSGDRSLLKPKPKPIVENPNPDPNGDVIDLDGCSRICSQIERLVFFKRFADALDLFEILRLRAGAGAMRASTYDALIEACIRVRSASDARSLLHHMIEGGLVLDLYTRNRVLLMHLKCGMAADARNLFDEIPARDAVSWSTMISCLVESGLYQDAIEVFSDMWREMPEAAVSLFPTVIRASAGLGEILFGSQLHACVVKLGLFEQIYVSCSLIDMYSKCGCIEEAQWVFDEISEKNVVAWNTIIAGYALHGYSEKALDLYYEMRRSGVKLDQFTYSIVIRICVRAGSLEHAKQAHAGLVRNGLGLDLVASTALVDFYSKWGRMQDARHVFDMMPSKNLISWNSMIGGYANNGMGKEAISMFDRMLKEGMMPNHVTFLAVLSACSCSGLLERGKEIFDSMSQDPKMQPRAMHYACMIELFGREGRLDEAVSLINNAPFTPTKNMWAALLTACRIHKNLELGKFAAEMLFGMEPEKLSNYIVLLNIYNNCGKVADSAKVLEILKKKGLRLTPACTWIEVRKQPHRFVFGDKSHPQSAEIYKKLDDLMEEIGKFGYAVERKKPLLPDVGEYEQRISEYHSEKLAIAFGLISTPESTPLQLVQGHRVCSNCHTAIKLITVIRKREIVIRDASRFHHFRDGGCSCGDYW